MVAQAVGAGVWFRQASLDMAKTDREVGAVHSQCSASFAQAQTKANGAQ